MTLSGTIHAPAVDIDGDEDPDIVAIVSQDWEEIYKFENNGSGDFEAKVVYGSTNKDFGSSGISMSDGEVELVTGGFHFYPPYDKISRVSLWRRTDSNK